MYYTGNLHSPVYTLIAAVPRFTLKGTMHIVAVLVVFVLFVNFYYKFYVKIRSRSCTVTWLWAKSNAVRFSVEETSVFQAF